MHRKITRRDFINGVAVTAGAAMMPWHLIADDPAAPEKSPNYYPPALTGMRGSHPGASDVAHSLSDGTFWDSIGKIEDTGETYDLIVVGGGISGLSAAHFFRKAAGSNARILILDNHDDFGGHAKRNEFRVNDAFRLGFGGTFSIESPAPYSAVAKGLIEELGIEVPSFSKYVNRNLYHSLGLGPKMFFDKETFGVDKLAPSFNPRWGGEGDDPTSETSMLAKFLAEAPIAEQAKRDFQRLYKEPKDYYPGLTSDQKKDKLARISYASFLKDVAGVHEDIVKVYQAFPHGLFGVGIDAVAAQDAWGFGLPGFNGLKLDPAPGKGMNRDAIPNEEAEKYFFHFPDGNASIARLLVRKLIPGAIPGTTWTDVVTAKANYAKLDEASSPVRIRLNTTAVRVRHLGNPATAVEVTYAEAGKVIQRGRRMRFWRAGTSSFPTSAMSFLTNRSKRSRPRKKFLCSIPMSPSANGLRSRRSAASSVYAPGMYHTGINLDMPVSIGGYECTHKPEDPIIVHMTKAACHPGLPAREQHHRGRMELYCDYIRDHGAQHPRSTGSHPWPGWIRSRARHRRDHRQSLAPRLRLRIQLAVRFVLAGGRRNTLRGGS